MGLFSQFQSDPTAKAGTLEANILHLFAWGATLSRLGYDLVTLPATAFFAYALLVEGAVDVTNMWTQLIGYGLLIVSAVSALFALICAGGYLTAFNVTSAADTLIQTLVGSFPQIASLIPALGFAWLIFDSNNVEEGADDAEEEELDA